MLEYVVIELQNTDLIQFVIDFERLEPSTKIDFTILKQKL